MIKVLTKMENVKKKMAELCEAVAAKGSVLVIGLIEGQGDSSVIAAAQGKPVMITDAIAKLVSDDSAYAISKMLEEGLALAALYKIAGHHADKVEVETNK